MEARGYKEFRNAVLEDFIKEAKKSGYWIFSIESKNWYSPAEFITLIENKTINLRDGWIANYKIMNPIKGLDAADIQITKLIEKRASFLRKMLEFYQQNK